MQHYEKFTPEEKENFDKALLALSKYPLLFIAFLLAIGLNESERLKFIKTYYPDKK